MSRAEDSKREFLAVACECWRSLLAPSSSGFSGQAVGHIELELVCVSRRSSLWARVQFYIKGSSRNIARRRILPDDFSLLDKLVEPRQHELAELHIAGYCRLAISEPKSAKYSVQVASDSERWYLHIFHVVKQLEQVNLWKQNAYVIRDHADTARWLGWMCLLQKITIGKALDVLL